MNPVFKLLNEQKGIKLSIKSMSKILNVKTRAIVYYCFKDSRIRRVNGLEIGSGKSDMNANVFALTSSWPKFIPILNGSA